MRDVPYIEVRKTAWGQWGVWFDGALISTHRTRDAAAQAANNHYRETTR